MVHIWVLNELTLREHIYIKLTSLKFGIDSQFYSIVTIFHQSLVYGCEKTFEFNKIHIQTFTHLCVCVCV